MQSRRQPDESKNGGDVVPTLTLLLLILSFFFGLAWFLYSPYIAWGTAQTALLLRYLLFPFSILMTPDMADFIQNMRPHLESNFDYANVTVGEVMFLQSIIFRAISVILVPLLIWRAISNLVFARQKAFTRVLTLLDLAEIQSTRYPRVKPAIKAKLLSQDQRLGPWATSRNPLPYLIHHNLVTDFEDPEATSVGIPRMANLDEKGQLDHLKEYHGRLLINEASVRELLKKQLGSLCKYNDEDLIDIHALPKIEHALAIIFLATRTEDRSVRKRINQLLDQFGDSFEEGKLASADQPGTPHKIDLSGVDELWDDVKEHPKLKRTLLNASKHHAYWSTFFTCIFTHVYQDFRNLKSRDFIFLKPVNRALYLVCNQVGLESARAETCAVRAQYLAEIELETPIIEPQLEAQQYQLLLHIQNEGWLHKDLVEDDMEVFLTELDKQYAQNLNEYKEHQREKDDSKAKDYSYG